MPTEDITSTVFPEGEQQPPQGGEQQAEAAPQPEVEYIPFKVRGQERQISATSLDQLANELQTNRDTALMWLQSGKDYGQHVSEYRQRERELAQREAEVNAYYQQIERERAKQTQRPGQPQAAGVPQSDDPMELLRWQAQQLLAIQQRVDEQQKAFSEERDYFKQAMAEQEKERIATQIQDAWNSFDKDRKAQNLPEVPFEEIEREAMMSGLANSRLPWNEVFQRAYRNLAWDSARSTTERTTLQKLRDPRATVTVPGGNSASPTPKPQGSAAEQALQGMKWGDIIESIPERR